jgi:hypothetical protein
MSHKQAKRRRRKKMVVNFAVEFVTLDGKPVMDESKPDEKKPFTLQTVAENVLQLSFADEQNLPGTEKQKRWALAVKIHAATEPLALQAEDIVLLKLLIGKWGGPMIVGQAYEMLEGNSTQLP